MAMLNLPLLGSDLTYYQIAFDAYKRHMYHEGFEDMWKDICGMFTFDDSKEDEICVLIVGPGKGENEIKVLNFVLKRHSSVYVRVIEPDKTAVSHFKEECDRLKKTHPNLRYEFFMNTFQEYIAKSRQSEDESKFHFVVCIASLYYMDDITDALEHLHIMIKSTGIIVSDMIDHTSSVGKLFIKQWEDETYPVTLQSGKGIKDVLQRKGWQFELKYRRAELDVSLLLDNEPEGTLVLDFIMHVVNFRHAAPKTYVDEIFSLIWQMVENVGDKKMLSANREVVVISK
ncbi:histamine N-methyltransferase-like [Ptychodera flava]|uniref:histamine N-methyltransferase-like n=1 Tax=Ptychodera flava TaxID=63121 RepID=UPI00396A2F85